MRKKVHRSPLLSPMLDQAFSLESTNGRQHERARKAASVPPAGYLSEIAAAASIPLISHVRLFRPIHKPIKSARMAEMLLPAANPNTIDLRIVRY
jgi:hypothetical protein